MKSLRLNRRHVLRGMLGGSAIRIGLPTLDAMLNSHGTALAAGEPFPSRFITFFFGNGRGVDAARWNPVQTGADFTLSPQLAPLEKVKPYVNVLSGFSSKLTRSPQGHHKGTVALFCGHDLVIQQPSGGPFRSTYSMPSLDQVVAAQIGKTTKFPSIQVGIASSVIRGEGTTLQHFSHNGPDNPNPAEYNPATLFSRLFTGQPATPGSGAGNSETERLRQVQLEMRKSALDFVRADIDGLRARVGTRDRARLDQHTQNIRDIEKLLVTSPAGGAAAASCAAAGSAPENPPGTGAREPHEERSQLMSRVVTMAFACDLTRVASIHFSGSAANPVFWQVGATRGHHQLSHDGRATQSIIDTCTIFTIKQFAFLMEALQGTADGDGNLLDRTAAFVSSDTSDGALHSTNDMPILIVGRANSALKFPGIHLRASGDNNTGRVLFSLVRAMGLRPTEFGGGGGRVTMGVPEIEGTIV